MATNTTGLSQETLNQVGRNSLGSLEYRIINQNRLNPPRTVEEVFKNRLFNGNAGGGSTNMTNRAIAPVVNNNNNRSGNMIAYPNGNPSSMAFDSTQNLALQPQGQVQPFTVNETNAPNTSPQVRELSNAYLDLNKRIFDLQSQQIQLQYNQQSQGLEQAAKDANSQNLRMFGESALADSQDSSRNLSFLTNVKAKVSQELRNIQNNAIFALNQNAANYATNNLQAMQMNRTFDFQDRQQNFNEAITRGQETGQQYEYNPATGKVENTGRLTLQGKAFDAEQTGWYTDFGGNKVRTLNAQQIDSNLLNQAIQRSLTFSDVTGLMPDFSGIMSPDGTTNRFFDFTNNTGQLTVQGQLNQAAVSQANYNKNLYDSMNNQGMFDLEAAARAQELRTKIVGDYTSSKQYQQILNNIAQYAGTNAGLAGANQNAALAEFQQNPTMENYKKLLQATNQMNASFGDGNGLYYDVITNFDENFNPELEFKYKKGSLALHGYNGDTNFTSPGSPQFQEQLDKMRSSFTEEFLNALQNSPDISGQINKLFFADQRDNDGDGTPDGLKTLLALRSVDNNGVGNGYQFNELDMSGMKPEDVFALQDSIQKARLNEGGNVKKNLEGLQKIIDSYRSKGLKSNTVNATDFIKRMKEYNIGEKQVFDGLNNSQVMNLVLLGGRPGSKGIIKGDIALNDFTNTMSRLQNAFNNISQAFGGLNGNDIDTNYILEQIRSGNDVIKARKGTGNIPTVANFISKADVSKSEYQTLQSLMDWFFQYRSSNNGNTAAEYLNAVLANNGINQTSFSLGGNKSISFVDLFASR